METINWNSPLAFILRGDAYVCAGGSTQLSIGLLNHGSQGAAPLGVGGGGGGITNEGVTYLVTCQGSNNGLIKQIKSIRV